MQKKSKKGQMQKNSKKVNNLPKRSQVKPAGGVVRHGGDETVGGGEGALEVKKTMKRFFIFAALFTLIVCRSYFKLSCTAAPLKGCKLRL